MQVLVGVLVGVLVVVVVVVIEVVVVVVVVVAVVAAISDEERQTPALRMGEHGLEVSGWAGGTEGDNGAVDGRADRQAECVVKGNARVVSARAGGLVDE